MAVAFDLLRNTRQLNRCCMVGSVQSGDDFFNAGAVAVNQCALAAALFGVAEHIQRRAAQALEARQQPEGAGYPRAELAFLQLALVVAAGQQRRGQVVVDFEVAFEHGLDLFFKSALRVQARHLVLVFVGHQLKESPRHRLAQQVLAAHGLGQAFFSGLHARHQGRVALGISSILVIGQKLDAASHQRVQALAGSRHVYHLRWRIQVLHRRQIASRAPAPSECRLVVVHRDGVELNGAHH